MIRPFFFLLALVLHGISFSQTVRFKNPGSMEHDRLRASYKQNGVKGITVIAFKSIADANANNNGIIEEKSIIDANGFVISSTQIVEHGREITVTQRFDSTGNLLHFRQYFGANLNQEGMYYYDPDGEMVSRVTINASGRRDSVINKAKVEYLDGKKITTNAPGAFAAKTIEEMEIKIESIGALYWVRRDDQFR